MQNESLIVILQRFTYLPDDIVINSSLACCLIGMRFQDASIPLIFMMVHSMTVRGGYKKVAFSLKFCFWRFFRFCAVRLDEDGRIIYHKCMNYAQKRQDIIKKRQEDIYKKQAKKISTSQQNQEDE